MARIEGVPALMTRIAYRFTRRRFAQLIRPERERQAAHMGA